MLATRIETATPTADPLGEAADPSAVADALVSAVALTTHGPGSAVMVTLTGISARDVVLVMLIANAAATEMSPDWFDVALGVARATRS